MTKSHPKWVRILYGPFFRVIEFFYRVYTANRERVKRLTEGKFFSNLIRNGAVVLVFAWILIWLFASDENRDRLNQEIKASLGSYNTQVEE